MYLFISIESENIYKGRAERRGERMPSRHHAICAEPHSGHDLRNLEVTISRFLRS